MKKVYSAYRIYNVVDCNTNKAFANVSVVSFDASTHCVPLLSDEERKSFVCFIRSLKLLPPH